MSTFISNEATRKLTRTEQAAAIANGKHEIAANNAFCMENKRETVNMSLQFKNGLVKFQTSYCYAQQETVCSITISSTDVYEM